MVNFLEQDTYYGVLWCAYVDMSVSSFAKFMYELHFHVKAVPIDFMLTWALEVPTGRTVCEISFVMWHTNINPADFVQAHLQLAEAVISRLHRDGIVLHPYL